MIMTATITQNPACRTDREQGRGFTAVDADKCCGETVMVDDAMVVREMGAIAGNSDCSKYILQGERLASGGQGLRPCTHFRFRARWKEVCPLTP
ncbi:MAG: hypothetical protein ACOYO0_01545 [Sandarakinorhabdus sp.]